MNITKEQIVDFYKPCGAVKESDQSDLDYNEIRDKEGNLVQRYYSKAGEKEGEETLYEKSVITRRTNYSGNKMNGPMEIYESGNLLMITNYKDDLMHGPVYVFDANGISNKGNYKNGEKSGLFLVFEKGELLKQEIFQKNKLNGFSVTFYPKTGSIMESGMYLEDLKDGQWTVYDPEGKIIKKTYFESGVEMG
ncbi:toxin-antitoxin system YwqK family antitoxin [Candidatus Nesciobacter abundans]|uniref:Toxin-antitoxin system YwqK family antitoxin n=1 Tax=Candidatus Nesciobacter abundans TaxID=2601668 RepID=A0A5C0UKB7_9PROT|nr:hypothetical protein [Candidatus Nesciobacter abundans]QEK39304.1 hypothetical protein FZC36_02630 [Candidatus Nesciobacter abundans]